MRVRRVRDFDDLDLVKCGVCRGTGKQQFGPRERRQQNCPHCNGTGDRLVYNTRFVEQVVYSRSERRRMAA